MISRRAFLLGTGAVVLVGIPASASAVTLETTKGADGRYSVKLPLPVADKANGRGAVVVYNANKVLAIAHTKGLTRAQANNMLARVSRPALRGGAGGLVQSVLRWGLGLGFAWALKDAVVDLRGGNATTTTRTSSDCSSLPAPPSDIRSVSSGTFRSSGGGLATSYQRTTATGGTGTLPAKGDWTVAQQWNATRVGQTNAWKWDVVYTKNHPCGAVVSYPPTNTVKDAIPEANRKLEDAKKALRDLAREVWKKAKDTFDNLEDTLNGDPGFPGEKTDPGTAPDADDSIDMSDWFPDPSKADGGFDVGDLASDIADIFKDLGDLLFGNDVPFAGDEGQPAPGQPMPTPTPTPGTNPTPTPTPTPTPGTSDPSKEWDWTKYLPSMPDFGLPALPDMSLPEMATLAAPAIAAPQFATQCVNPAIGPFDASAFFGPEAAAWRVTFPVCDFIPPIASVMKPILTTAGYLAGAWRVMRRL